MAQNIYQKNIDPTKVRLMNNFVLVKPTRAHNELDMSNGEKLFIDPSFDKEKHAPTSGVVVNVPEKLYFGRNQSNTNEYDVDMELQVGDTIVFHFLTYQTCIDRKWFMVLDNELYLMVKYDCIFIARRKDKVIPINGWVVVEPLVETIETTIELPDHIKNKSSLTKGIVKYLGSPVRNYSWDFDHKSKYGADTDEIKVGDTVMFSAEDSIPLQYEMHAIIDKGTELYRMHRKDIFLLDNVIA